jgi:hypothetical protein
VIALHEALEMLLQETALPRKPPAAPEPSSNEEHEFSNQCVTHRTVLTAP